MADYEVTLREGTLEQDGLERFSGVLNGDIGGSQPGGLAIYGDGSDGDITVDSDTFSLPDPSTGYDPWTPATAYAVGDLIVTEDDHPRIYECIKAGTSGGSAPWYDVGTPGLNRRGDRMDEGGGRPMWEQETAICEGWVEGPIFAQDFTVEEGVTLNSPGWPILARGTATIAGTLSGNGIALDSDQATGSNSFGFSWPDIVTLLGRGVRGVATGVGAVGATWGGGIGGEGGAGADGDGNPPGITYGEDASAFTLARRMYGTMFSPFWLSTDHASIGSSGGAGADDTGNGKIGGASGSAGSGLAVLAKTIVLTGSVSARGDDGSAGEAGGDTGGGGAGSGGCIVLIYNAKTGAGTTVTEGGTGGAGQGTGADGQDGSPGEYIATGNA